MATKLEEQLVFTLRRMAADADAALSQLVDTAFENSKLVDQVPAIQKGLETIRDGVGNLAADIAKRVGMP